jgi:hypothetical protein
MKIRPMGAELYNVDGQTDMTMLIVAFCTLRTRLKTKNRLEVTSVTATRQF